MFLAFLASEVRVHSLAHGPFFHFQSWQLLPPASASVITSSLTFLLPTYKDAYDVIGPMK